MCRTPLGANSYLSKDDITQSSLNGTIEITKVFISCDHAEGHDLTFICIEVCCSHEIEASIIPQCKNAYKIDSIVFEGKANISRRARRCTVRPEQ